jgi:hemolysin activation/secretion protein
MSKFLEVGVEVFRGAIVLALFAMIAALPAEKAYGQATPPPRGIPQPQYEPNIINPVRPNIPSEPSRESPPPALTPPPAAGNGIPEGADKVTVVVKDIKIEGATAYTAEELAPYYTKLIGQTVPVSEIFEAAEAITLKYREDGYILSQALVPEQRVSDGVYTIRVVEGYVSEVVVTGDIGAVRDLIQDMVNHIPEERPINNATIERYLLLARDVPGIALTGVFRVAAGGAGARQLVLQVSRKEFGGNFAYDNRGSRFLGPGEMSGEVQVNSFTTYGERLDFVYFNTLSLLKGHPIIGVGGGDDQRFGEATFSAYLGSDGLQMKIFAGAGPANPGYTLASALFHSDLETAGASLEYPIVRSRSFDLKVKEQIDLTNSTVRTGANQTLASGTFLRVFRSYLTTDFSDGIDASYDMELSMSRGEHILGALNKNGSNVFTLPRPDARSEFTKVNFDGSRLQHIHDFDDGPLDLQFAISGQWSNDILYPNEEFRLGGFTYGRGYWAGRLTGDHGVGGTIEPRFNSVSGLPFINDDDFLPQYYAFFDAGRVWSKSSGDTGPFSLASVGGGVRITSWEWLHTDLELAHPLTIPTYAVSGQPASKPPVEVYGRIVAAF